MYEREMASDPNNVRIISSGAFSRIVDDDALTRQLRALQRKPFARRSFRDLFGNPAPQRSAQFFKTFDEFSAVVWRGLHHPGLVAAPGMNETVGSAGGFLVSEEHVVQMLDKSLENEIVRPRCFVVPMKSSTKKIAGFENKNNSSSAPFGGFSLQWLTEGGTISTKQAKTRVHTLTANKAGILVPVSNELLEDGTNFEEQLAIAIIASLGWGIDDACLNGTGARLFPLQSS